jgi:hypothetical protein
MRLHPPFYPIYVVLNEAPRDVEAVVSFLCRKIINGLIEAHALPPEPWNHHECAASGLTDNLKPILDAAHQVSPELKIVLLLDEADYIIRIDDRLQNIMRAALQSQEVGRDIRAVVAGTTDLSTYVSQRSSPFFNHFRFVSLKPLSAGETRELITKPAGSLNYTYDPAAIERIMRACRGHPYYCQYICYETFALAVDLERSLIGFSQAEAAVKKVISSEDAYNGFITGFWLPSRPREPLTRPQKRFLTSLASGRASSKITAQSVKRLLDWQIVTERDGSYAYTCELFREWVKRTSR